MKKPSSLRAHLLAAIPALEHNPDRLLIFVENGHIAATYAPNLSYQYQYQLELVITDWAGGPEAVMVPLLQWLVRNQPELLANPANRGQIAFEVDVLADDLVDLALKLSLSERVVVTPTADGGFDLQFKAEPWFDDGHAAILDGGQVTTNGEALVTLPAITQ